MTENEITEIVVAWCKKQPEATILKGDPGVVGYSFEIVNTTTNVHRLTCVPWTKIMVGVALGEDDLDYYELVGENDWKVIVRMLANQLDRGEVEFHDFPGYSLTDYLYDDAFSIDALYHRVRSVASASNYILMSMKHAKVMARTRMLGNSQTNLIPQIEDSEEDVDKDMEDIMAAVTAWTDRFFQGVDYLKDGKLEKAEKEFKKAVERNPKDMASWFNLAGVRDSLSRVAYGNAETCIKEHLNILETEFGGIDTDDDVETMVNLGVALAKQFKLEEAESIFRRAIEYRCDHIIAWKGLGRTLWMQGRIDEAKEAFAKADTLDD